MSVSDIKTSTGSADKDGKVICTLKFKVACDGPEIDMWFWFCKQQHRMFYELTATDDMLMLAGRSGLNLSKGQKRLEDIDEKGVDE